MFRNINAGRSIQGQVTNQRSRSSGNDGAAAVGNEGGQNDGVTTESGEGGGDAVPVPEVQVQLRNEIRNIMDNVVTATLVKRYTNGIVNFFLWVYDTELHFLFKFWFLNMLNESHAEDTSLPERKQAARKNLRNSIKDTIALIDRDDATTHPFCLTLLTFDIFSRYLTSRKKKILVNNKRRRGNGDGGGGEDGAPEVLEEEEQEVYLAKSSYDGIRSSIMHLYRICDAEMDEQFQKSLTMYIAGIKRVVAQEKKETGQKLSEGKRDMPLKVSG